MLAKKIALARFNKQPEPFQKIEFPTLQSIAINEVALNFELYPHLSGLNENMKQTIISKTSKTLPITVTYQNISDEDYWHKSCDTRWKSTHRTINVDRHGQSWKVAYMENLLEEYIRDIKSLEEPEQKQEFINQLKAVCNYVFTLNIAQTQCNIEISTICQFLPCLTNLQIVYGIKTNGLDYKKKTLGMKLSQAAELGEAISKTCNNLLSLSLPSNLIDDDLLRFLMAGINMNISLIEINLSHNRIGDQGARRIAKFLMRCDLLLFLDLSNNQIGYDGSRYIAQSLKINKSLQSLNLSLNVFNDKAGMKFFKDLGINKSITDLDMSGNMLAYQSSLKVSDFIADSQCILKNLRIGNNNFTDDCFEMLKVGFTKNFSLIKLDISECKFHKQGSEQDLMDIVIKHHLNHLKVPFVTKEEMQLMQKKLTDSQLQLGQKKTEEVMAI